MSCHRLGFWGAWIWLFLFLIIFGCKPEANVVQMSTQVGGGSEATELATTLSIEIASVTIPTEVNHIQPNTTISPSPNSTPSQTPTPSHTSDPYENYTINYLTQREYGGGTLQVKGVMAENSYFTRYLVSYPSDGLLIYGFMNVPKRGEPPYRVVIALHGYIEPEIYSTLDYTTGYADALAVAGFFVLHPNLRGYQPSDSGDNLFRVGMATDVLNLIALVEKEASRPGALELAEANSIGVWGHSMGGGIATKVITVNPKVRAAVLYGAMSGDEEQNYERIYNYFSDGTRGTEELAVPDEVFQQVSPINYLDRIQAAVSIHHGEEDQEVPLSWSQDTCRRLQELQKNVECFTYPGQGHTFHDEGETLFIQRMIEFFRKYLDGKP